jgi:hypothetical protein
MFFRPREYQINAQQNLSNPLTKKGKKKKKEKKMKVDTG